MCGSTCFGRLPTHRQEHTAALGASGFTIGRKWLERCWSWSGQPDHDQQCGETPETCRATRKRQVINL